MTDAPAISVTGVSKSFAVPHQQRTTLKEHFLHPFRRDTVDVQRALDDVTFSIEPGEFFGIMGPNGSGKSTLLKIVAGIYPPDTGHVCVDGLLSPFIELGVGFNPELTGRDNIRVNATLLGLGKRELEERYGGIVAFAGLERYIDRKLKNYSSGMLMRLAFSIAIQVDFDILLLDEVFAVGDVAFQEKCIATFDGFRQAGKTIVLVTHDPVSVWNLCDRVLLLTDGRVTGVGPVRDVLQEPEPVEVEP